jgi:hypothetical protein
MAWATVLVFVFGTVLIFAGLPPLCHVSLSCQANDYEKPIRKCQGKSARTQSGIDVEAPVPHICRSQVWGFSLGLPGNALPLGQVRITPGTHD